MGFILGAILGNALIPTIIFIIAKIIDKKYTFKGIFPKAFLICSFIHLMINIYKINHIIYPNIEELILADILSIIISLVFIFSNNQTDEQNINYTKPKYDVSYNLQKSLDYKENLKKAFQNGLITENEYEKKLAQIDKESEILNKINEYLDKVKILDQKRDDLTNLYHNLILTEEEFNSKYEEVIKERKTHLLEINNLSQSIINKKEIEETRREERKSNKIKTDKRKKEKLDFLRRQYLFRAINEATYHKKLKELEEDTN